MAIVSLIAANTTAGDAALETLDDVQLIATKLGAEEYIFISIYGLAGDTEIFATLSNRNSSMVLPGPSKYHVNKPVTAVSLGVGYHVLTVA